jgi:hypothetical protein
MVDNSGATPTSVHARVRSKGNNNTPIGGIDTREGAALLVTDAGREDFATQTNLAFSITATAARLSSFNADKLDVIARRGFQFKASSSNTGDISLGGSAVVGSATASAVNGIPLGPGESLFVEVTQLSHIWADSSTGTQILHWIAY